MEKVIVLNKMQAALLSKIQDVDAENIIPGQIGRIQGMPVIVDEASDFDTNPQKLNKFDIALQQIATLKRRKLAKSEHMQYLAQLAEWDYGKKSLHMFKQKVLELNKIYSPKPRRRI